MCRERKDLKIVAQNPVMMYEAKHVNAESETLCFRLIMIIMLIAGLSMLGWNGQAFSTPSNFVLFFFHICVFERFLHLSLCHV